MTHLLTIAQAGFPTPMASATLYHYLITSALLFVIGLIGFVTRRNLIIMFLCTELMFQAAGIALIGEGAASPSGGRGLRLKAGPDS